MTSPRDCHLGRPPCPWSQTRLPKLPSPCPAPLWSPGDRPRDTRIETWSSRNSSVPFPTQTGAYHWHLGGSSVTSDRFRAFSLWSLYNGGDVGLLRQRFGRGTATTRGDSSF